MAQLWEAIQTNLIVFILVAIRVSCIFTFNPIFARSGVPTLVKAGGSLLLAVVMTTAGGFEYTMPDGLLPFAVDCVKELIVGVVLGFFVNLMLQVFSMAGEVADMQIGLSMAKGYDPTFGSAGMSTQLYSLWFMLYFFAVDGHLSYIQLFKLSYDTIPLGYQGLDINFTYIMVQYFQTVLTLGLKLAMPIVAASLITEFCIGVLMKAVPTIHVFVLNIQIKMLVGLVVLAASCGVVSEFMEELMSLLFTNLNGLVEQIAVSG